MELPCTHTVPAMIYCKQAAFQKYLQHNVTLHNINILKTRATKFRAMKILPKQCQMVQITLALAYVMPLLDQNKTGSANCDLAPSKQQVSRPQILVHDRMFTTTPWASSQTNYTAKITSKPCHYPFHKPMERMSCRINMQASQDSAHAL